MFRNKRKSKCMAAALSAALLLTPVMTTSVYAADPSAVNLIHEERTTQTVTQGVTLEKLTRFTKDGWYNFHILKVDLSNKHISVDTLTNIESFSKRASTLKLAEQSGAVAAVNGSFFTPAGTGIGYPIGVIVESSDIQSASDNINRYSNSMASLSITGDNSALLDFWKADLSLVSDAGATVPFHHYNKASANDYTQIYVYDSKWGETAVGATDEMPDLFQMVVNNGVVTDLITGKPAQPIPENGFVAVARAADANKIKSAFTLGDNVSMSIVTTPDWQDIKMSVSGSAILVDNGVIPTKFSFAASDTLIRSPKTALGFSKDRKTMYLVTVDGRQTSSIGLTLNDMALFMQSIGAYNAINMDGGGSTTMVARPMGEQNVKLMNKPSDGVTRSVINGVGVFTSAPESELTGLIVETNDKYMFTNGTREFLVKGYDKYNNPVPVDPSCVEWSVSGVKGEFEGNVFRPSTNGEGVVIASVGEISTSKGISVLSRPVALEISSTTLKLPIGKTKAFKVTGINPKGYRASIEPNDLNWNVTNELGSFKNGVFTAEKRGVGYIEASFGDTLAYCSVSVSSDISTIVEKFEELKGSFQSYPIMVEGYYNISNEQKVSGKSSGKLEYNFATHTDVTRAAYYVLPDEGYTIKSGVSKIGLQVYSDHENSSWLRAELVDAEGKKQMVDLAKPIDWSGWKYVNVSVENIKMPAKLTKIYIVQTNPDQDTGCLYLDDLTLTVSGYPSLKGVEIPESLPFKDEQNVVASFKGATSDSFRFGVVGQSAEPVNDVQKKLVKLFADKVTKYLEVGAVVGSGSHESITGQVKKKPVIATHTVDLKSTKAVDYNYSVTDYKSNRFIKLDTRKKGLRLSDSDQWGKLIKDLESFEGSNVFIFMDTKPDSFSDKLELELFKRTLMEYRYNTLKNVSVFYNGSKNECHLENGVRYFETAGYSVPGINSKDTSNAQYVLVTVKGDAVTYVYKPIDS